MNFAIAEESARSTDGTRIGFRTTGTGPGLVLVPGALALARDFDGFARELAKAYTVYTIERRGRGASGPQGAEYSLEREVEDVHAVAAVTGARLIVGHSFGGLVVLEAVRSGGLFDAVAVYEPGVLLGEGEGPVSVTWADRCAEQLAEGRHHDAFTTFVQGVNPETSGKAPLPVLSVILRLAIRSAERKQKYELLKGTIREHQEAARIANQPERYSGIKTPVLLLAGKDLGITAAGRGTERLESVLRHARLESFPRLDHFGPEKAAALLAERITRFFARSATTSASVDSLGHSGREID